MVRESGFTCCVEPGSEVLEIRALTNRLPAIELTENVRQQAAWERQALGELRNGSAQQAMQAYVEHRRLVLGRNRTDTVTKASSDWYRYVQSTGDVSSALLLAHDNDTVTELNEQARQHLAASGRLHEPALDGPGMVLQAGDRILCRRNQHGLDVLNGDLGTVTAVDQDAGTVTVRLDRDPEVRELPGWYLNEGNVGYGYALTAHKAQGITTERTFTVITGVTEREWAYVALSRGRDANTLYLAPHEAGDEECTHLTYQKRHVGTDIASAMVARSRAQIAAIEQEPARETASPFIVEHDHSTWFLDIGITCILNLVCQGAWGLGGQDWDGPHRGGQALIRSHRPLKNGWVGSTGHYEDSIR